MRVSGWTRSALLAALTALGYAVGSSIAWRLLDAEATLTDERIDAAVAAAVARAERAFGARWRG